MIDRFYKQPSEKFNVSIDFNNVLGDDETISSYVLTCININDNSDTSTDVIDSDSNTTVSITIKVKAGADGENHKITVKITTSDSNIFEKDVLMKVVEE